MDGGGFCSRRPGRFHAHPPSAGLDRLRRLEVPPRPAACGSAGSDKPVGEACSESTDLARESTSVPTRTLTVRMWLADRKDGYYPDDEARLQNGPD